MWFCRQVTSRPVGLLPGGVFVVRQIRKNGPPQLRDIRCAELLVEDVAVWREQERERQRRGHRRVEGGLQLVDVRRGELQIPVRGVVLLQELDHAGFLLRVVGRHGHEIHAAAAVHAIGRFQIGELAHARRAPRRPEVDHQQFPGAVLPQLLQPVGAHHLERHGFGRNRGLLGLRSAGLRQERWRAPDGGRVGNRHRTAGEERIDRVARVARGDGVFTRADCRSGPGSAARDPCRTRRSAASPRP